MKLDNILKRRALRLKSELAEGARPKPSFLSVIYPATDHEGIPQVVKTPSSVPNSNDADAEEVGQKEKKQKEVDEPGPSKTTSSSLLVIPGQSAFVPDAHKRTAFELGYFGENRSERFIKRCVELITGVKKLEQDDPTEGDDVDVSGANGHGHGEGHSHTNDDTPGSNGDGNSNGSGEGHEHSKLSDVVKKLQKPKSYE